MKKIILSLLTITTLQAALPPLTQSAREIQQIVSAPALYQKLGGAHPIEKIEKLESGYQVFTRDRSIYVEVIYLPLSQPGPAHFKLEFSESVKN